MNQQDTEQLRREIERTRTELGATVEALSHKADVKAHARARAERAKSQAQDNPAVPLAAGIGAAIVALWLIRRRRNS
jgi:alpha-beta hydrolase superfamily lysophospholipase